MLAPEIALASTDPVRVPVVGVLGGAGHDSVNAVPSSVVASNTFWSVCSSWGFMVVNDDGGQTNATAKFVVPSGNLSESWLPLSVAAVNEPEPIRVATAVGVAPFTVKVTVVELSPPPEPPLLELPIRGAAATGDEYKPST